MLQSYLMISLNCSFCLLLLLVSIFICAIKKKYIVLHIVNSMHNKGPADKYFPKVGIVLAKELEIAYIHIL